MKINTCIHLNRRVRNNRMFYYDVNKRDVLLEGGDWKWGSVTIERVNDDTFCIYAKNMLTTCFYVVQKEIKYIQKFINN
jgi:hypothetical protein